MKTTLESFLAQKELLSDPSRWTKGTFARDKFGNSKFLPDDDLAVCWCQAGAWHKVSTIDGGNSGYGVRDTRIKNDVVSHMSAHHKNAVSFNDSLKTTHDDLMEFYDRCIAYARNLEL